jgi:hypothetical protein
MHEAMPHGMEGWDMASMNEGEGRDEWQAMKLVKPAGGLTLEVLQRLASRRLLTREDLVWHAGWEGWRTAGEVPELAPAFAEAELANDFAISPSKPRAEEASDHEVGIASRLRHEILSFLAIAVYLWFVLIFLRLYEWMALERNGMQVPSNPSLFVEILVIGKVILIAEALKFGNRFTMATPIASIAVRSFVFALLLLLIHLLENTIEAWWHGKSIVQALLGATSWRDALVMTGILTIGMLPYQAFKEVQNLSRDINLMSRLLGRPAPV